MRNLSAEALAKIATEQGTEPICVIEVEWGGTAARVFYSDKEYASLGIQGRITQLGEINEVVQVSGGGKSEQMNVTLSDTDGAIKAIFDSTDVHKKSCRVWQWFAGLDFDDKFLVFKGQINSPVVWSESERTLSFSIVNRIEDVEVGFSAEEGQFLFLPDELIGQPWPLCFGTVVNVPALKAVPANSGTLASGVGIKDFTLKRRIGLAEAIVCPENLVGWGKLVPVQGAGYLAVPQYRVDDNCVRQRCTETERLKLALAEQSVYEFSLITVFGGSRFPQNTPITLNINGGKFVGYFGAGGDPEAFTITARIHPKNDGNGGVLADSEEEALIRSKCEQQGKDTFRGGTKDDDANEDGHSWWWTDPRYLGKQPPSQVLNARKSRITWENYRAAREAGFFWASGGSSVRQDNNDEIIYIANILPSTVLRVAAWRTVNGNRFLLTVPSSYYSIRQTDYTGYDVVEIVLTTPLSLRGLDSGGGWEDDLYVTLTSSVGPNTVDVIRWFIEKYTEYAIDEDSFDATRALIDNYPTHFPLLRRPNLLTVLQELATQSRCALWQKNDTFFIRYLAKEPTPVATITKADTLTETISLELTSTEDICTKLVAEWRKDYSIPRSNTLILRHNVKYYGTHEKKSDYYAYNILSLVRKSATYEIIRKSNAWKRLKFSGPLTLLNLEAFDAVTLQLPELADGGVIGVVEKANYNSEENVIEFEIWTPVLAGTRVSYDYAFPADIQELALFPRIEERRVGKAGSGNEPNFSTIAPLDHPLRPRDPQSGGSINLDDDEEREDFGDKNPSDIGDTKPTVNTVADTGVNSTGDISVRSSPFSGNITNGFFNPQTSANDTAKEAANTANKAKEEAARANDAAGADENDASKEQPGVDKLPDPNEDEEKTANEHAEDCRFEVTFIMITPNLVTFPPAQSPPNFGSTPGDAGRAAISDFSDRHKIYFDSHRAANQFAVNVNNNWRALGKAWAQKVGTSYKALAIVGPDAGAECEPPEQAGVIGYTAPASGGPVPTIDAGDMNGI